jgi:hypothetical protein
MGEDAHPEILLKAEYDGKHMNDPSIRTIG